MSAQGEIVILSARDREQGQVEGEKKLALLPKTLMVLVS
jgi:hypothetical protein